MSARELRLAFASRDVPFGVQYIAVGVELAKLQPGHTLRIHLFSHSDNNGGERPAGDYVRERMRAAVREAIERGRLRAQLVEQPGDVLVRGI